MNKSISNKNSILRFKDGRKIVKALGGLPMVINGTRQVGRYLGNANSTRQVGRFLGDLVGIGPLVANVEDHRRKTVDELEKRKRRREEINSTILNGLQNGLRKSRTNRINGAILSGLQKGYNRGRLLGTIQKGLREGLERAFENKTENELNGTTSSIRKPYFLNGYTHNDISPDDIVSWLNKLADYYDPNAKYRTADGIWGADTETAYQNYLRAQNSIENPSNNTSESEKKYTPNNNAVNIVRGMGYSFSLPKPELPMLAPPDTRDYNRDNIRAMRGTYSNADLYFDYIKNNSNSNEARLWDNMWYGVNDWDKRRLIFDETMRLHGISGNLGRRDSGRLANLHNLLRQIAIEGSDSEKGFRSGLENELKKLLLYKKQGGQLISRNPILRFKSNFRLVAQ